MAFNKKNIRYSDRRRIYPDPEIVLREEFPAQSNRKTVFRILDNQSFITHDNEIIRIQGLNTPKPNTKGYTEALKDLTSILHNNATVKIKVISKEKDGSILAKVETKQGNVLEMMQAKGWKSDKPVKTKFVKKLFNPSEKPKWQKKYQKARSQKY